MFAASVSMVILGLFSVGTISANSSRQNGLKDIFPDSLQTIFCTDPKQSYSRDADEEEGGQHPQQAVRPRMIFGVKDKGCKCSFPPVNLSPN